MQYGRVYYFVMVGCVSLCRVVMFMPVLKRSFCVCWCVLVCVGVCVCWCMCGVVYSGVC